ncbi:putative N-acetylated-alpha-linked acidic dipeptidase [Physella acuta]|uniref:putative N-acetylated-alpha-linked acidic dipeptidase n=1 Tax=Physella acuta TaxID=109671 RepID=UPI0027DD3AFF|nr:putative N-acetylated-alpha-linked acidic dipeptidase [Physella acuta]
MGSLDQVHMSRTNQELGFKLQNRRSSFCLAVVLFIAAAIGLAVGLLLGRFALCTESVDPASKSRGGLQQVGNTSISQQVMAAVDAGRMEETLRQLSLKPHIAGQENDAVLARLVKDRFRQSGLHVQTTPYDVLLSYPAGTNSVRLVAADGTIIYDAVRDESDVTTRPDVVQPFHAYSPSGLVEGQVVYVGYGRVEDYTVLAGYGVDVTGHVVLVKYGKIFRGDKVEIAASHGAVGVLMYTDPADYTGWRAGDPRVYPDTWWMPPTGAQRGTVMSGQGDPSTPGLAANNLAYRRTDNLTTPTIPSQPIGYGAAYNILKQLSGAVAPTTWSGGLNITYRLGPGFLNSTWKLQLNVTNTNTRRKIENVFGIIEGEEEPDRYVLFGNHRDAWIYGAIDPSSGTAVMLEVARVMGELVQSGKWRPRRSIVFCSWGAEEFGLIGSTEWVEQYVAVLRERAVAYINVDLAVQGNDTLRALATPLMLDVLFEACKQVPNPDPAEVAAGRQTVYDTWYHVTPHNDVPATSGLGSGSDYAPLLQQAGVTSVDLRYSYDRKKYDISSYALYHTEYETFQLVKNHFDRDFQYHAAVAKVCGELLLSLADSLLLPFNLTTFALGLELLRATLERDHGPKLRVKLDNFDLLASVTKNFTADVANFESRRRLVDTSRALAVRALNDQMLLLEKAFLRPEGLPLRPLKKHVIYAENANDGYAGSSFPGLVELLFQIDEHPERWTTVKQHFSAILQTIQSAGATLRDVTSFMSESL